MAAPIFRYRDPRLIGSSLVEPSSFMYRSYIKPVIHPIHPKTHVIIEYALRFFRAFIGTAACLILLPITLAGRVSQIIHYHTLSENKRRNPPSVKVNGLSLPFLSKTTSPKKGYHGTNQDAVKKIFRENFQISNAKKSGVLGQAVYLSTGEEVSASYGENRVITKLDLDAREIAYLASPQSHFQKNPESIRDLFLKNGYRAIRYDLQHYGTDPAIAIFDPSCVSIQGGSKSPRVVSVSMMIR